MYLLDTNLVSLFDPRRKTHHGDLIDWSERNGDYLFLSVISLTEIESGILKLRRERKAQRAREIEVLLETITADFGPRILPVDAAVAFIIPRLAEAIRPRVVELSDLIVAATAKRNGLTVLTSNDRPFEGFSIDVVNPLKVLPPDAADRD